MPSKAYKTKLTRAQDRRAKATDEQVKEMRELYAKGATQKAIAEKYGLSPQTVCYIVNEKAHENLAKYRKIHPPKRRSKEEMAAYMCDLRKYKMNIYKEKNGKMKYIIKLNFPRIVAEQYIGNGSYSVAKERYAVLVTDEKEAKSYSSFGRAQSAIEKMFNEMRYANLHEAEYNICGIDEKTKEILIEYPDDYRT